MQKPLKLLHKLVSDIAQKVIVKYLFYLFVGIGGLGGLYQTLLSEKTKDSILNIIQLNISILGINLALYQWLVLIVVIILSFFGGLIFKNIKLRKPKYYEHKGFYWKYNIYKFFGLEVDENPYCINDKTKLIPERIKNYFYCPICDKKFDNTEHIEETIYTEVKHILESKFS